jgi:hypothetical protein
MRRGSAGRSLGSGTLSARRRRRGEARSLPPLAVENHRRLRSRPPPGPASLRWVRGLLLLARASCPRSSPRRSEGRCRRRALTWRRRVLPTLTRTSAWGIISLVSFFSRRLGLKQDHGAGSDAGQLVVVPTPVAATSPTVAVGVKGAL